MTVRYVWIVELQSLILCILTRFKILTMRKSLFVRMTKLSNAIDKFLNYPCSSCGSCCKRVDKGIANLEVFALHYNIPLEELQFPYSWDETGKCEMLDDQSKCKVYENRPNICNIAWVSERIKDKEKFYFDNIKSCNIMMDEDGLDKSFRIVI